jgi:hypothetical protein
MESLLQVLGMEPFLRYWLRWPSLERFFIRYTWAWPVCEVFHFVGLILLIGAVGMFDLRLLGIGKGLPVGPLRRLLPLGVLGFGLCVVTGLMFVGGVYANVETHPYVVLVKDVFLQWKLLFMFLAGMNLLVFYLTGASRAIDALGPGDDAPLLAKVVGGASLFLWLGVIFFGRLIPDGLP